MAQVSVIPPMRIARLSNYYLENIAFIFNCKSISAVKGDVASPRKFVSSLLYFAVATF